ncbi:hypothetical protein [Paenibacillus sp. MMS20-IR301]|uniref:hypothetical protein n=1 Tax=Paenibacillus sp. MMS20-IR301 TaxID=2895946 RepID=UPI0028E2BC0B|nr:hypothetical protein [Paenibacillus sp. MMS20-IR301]WNS44013.1 hypothetical protein LOS79_01735 [Paenibacillus sp. MMS20-IR301]
MTTDGVDVIGSGLLGDGLVMVLVVMMMVLLVLVVLVVLVMVMMVLVMIYIIPGLFQRSVKRRINFCRMSGSAGIVMRRFLSKLCSVTDMRDVKM